MSTEEEKGMHSRGEEFLQVFKKGAEFTQELMKENERLRYRIVELEESQQNIGQDVEDTDENRRLLYRIHELEREKEVILDRIRHVEEENQDFATRYVEIEQENNNLANLYIASYQLHSTLDFKEVLQIITEIIINLIGAEEFAIMLLDEKTNELQAVATEGVSREEIPSVQFGQRDNRSGREDGRKPFCRGWRRSFGSVQADGLHTFADQGTRNRSAGYL